MTDIIVTYKVKNLLDLNDTELTNEDVNDLLREIAEKNDMDLISWGTI